MKKYLILGLALIFSVGLVLAGKPDFQAVTITTPQTAEPKNTVVLPSKAIEVAPNIYYLGQAIDKGRLVEGYAIIDYKEGYGKPGTSCGNGICEPGENAVKCPADCGSTEPDTSSCYGFLAKGAKWKSIEPYIVNPANNADLGSSAIRNTIAAALNKWEDAADGTLGDGNSINIIGDENTSGIVDRANIGNLNSKNEVMFADISSSNVIAVTIVWGIWYGPPSGREIVEWDQVYDDADFAWSEDCTTENCTSIGNEKMDYDNIVTHEHGHVFGLDDLYDIKCSEMTMYGYAREGETNKRTLESGDIAGIQALYGT